MNLNALYIYNKTLIYHDTQVTWQQMINIEFSKNFFALYTHRFFFFLDNFWINNDIYLKNKTTLDTELKNHIWLKRKHYLLQFVLLMWAIFVVFVSSFWYMYTNNEITHNALWNLVTRNQSTFTPSIHLIRFQIFLKQR